MRTICVDLNGVLDTYSGWKGEAHTDPPRDGAADFLQALRTRGYRIAILSSRPESFVWDWLRTHGLDTLVDTVTATKVPAVVYVDDRAVCFQGDFTATLAAIDGFRAHWERPR